MVPVAGTDGASQLFWSPDSKSVGFTERGQNSSRVRRVDLTGRALTTVAEDARGRGAWSAKGVIILDRPQVGIFSVPENGGPPTPVTKVNAAAGDTDHMWPVFLPDGRRFLHMVRHRPAERHKNAIVLASLDSKESREILKANSNIELSAGYLLFGRDGTVYAQAFDAGTGRLSGEERPIVEGVAHNPANGRVAFSAAANAQTLAYRLGRTNGSINTMEWFDRSGTSLGILGGSDSLNRTYAISPDGTRVAVRAR